MSGRRLYIGRLSQDATRADVEAYFGTHGPIVDVRLMAGFCFLEYEELKDAEQAVSDFSGKEFMGERLIVEFAKPPRNVDPDREPRRFDDRRGGGFGGGGYGAPPPRGGPYGGAPYGGGYDRPSFGGPRGGGGHRLVVNGVPDGCSWQDLKDFARGAGTVTFADVDRNNPSIGFIEYPSRSDADEAIRSLSNTELKGVTVTIEEAASAGGGGGGRRDDGYPPRREERREDGYSSSRRDDGYSSRRPDERDDRRRDDYRRRSVSPRRERERSPRRERSPPRERERSPRREVERERSPARERKSEY